MRRALVLVVVAGCGVSPDDLFILSGRTVGTDGAPLDGVAVTASRIRYWPMQEPLRTVQTADAGQFSFDLVRAEIESLSRESLWLTHVEARFQSGTQAWTDLALYPSQLRLPTLYDWRPGLSVDDAGVVDFEPIAPTGRDCSGLPEAGHIAHAVVVSDEHGMLWQESDLLARSGADDAGFAVDSLEPRQIALHPDVLEDGPVGLGLEAKRFGCLIIAGGGLGGAEVQLVETRWRSQEVRFLVGTRRPASRGATCTGVRAGLCPLTDGSATAFLLARPTLRFQLQLKEPANVRSVVLRNLVTPYDLPRVRAIEVHAGGDSQRVEVPDEQVTLYDAIVLEEEAIGRIDWKRVELPRPLARAQQIEIELDVPAVQLGEISLFE